MTKAASDTFAKGLHARVGGRCRVAGLSLVCLLLPVGIAGQQSSAADPLERVSFFIGRWEGTSEGQPGKATVRREYTRVLNSRFIRVHNRSEYPPQDKNPRARYTRMRAGSVSTERVSASC